MKSPRPWAVSALSLLFFTACATPNADAPRELSKSDKVKTLLPIAAANITDNDPTSALQILAQVRDADDSNAEEYYLYALAYLQKKETKLATDSARRAIKLDPKYSAAKNTLGKLLLDQGKYEEAEQLLLESANDLVFRDAYLPKTNLGILYYKKGELAKSDLWLSKAIADGGSLICLAFFNRGKVRSDQNKLLAAERDYFEASRGSCAGMGEAHIAYGKTLIREKKYDQARAKFIEIQRLFPSSETSDHATQYLREIP
jgi:type IV pilus assembly protein PilF